jgi:hypothetical protein
VDGEEKSHALAITQLGKAAYSVTPICTENKMVDERRSLFLYDGLLITFQWFLTELKVAYRFRAYAMTVV